MHRMLAALATTAVCAGVAVAVAAPASAVGPNCVVSYETPATISISEPVTLLTIGLDIDSEDGSDCFSSYDISTELYAYGSAADVHKLHWSSTTRTGGGLALRAATLIPGTYLTGSDACTIGEFTCETATAEPVIKFAGKAHLALRQDKQGRSVFTARTRRYSRHGKYVAQKDTAQLQQLVGSTWTTVHTFHVPASGRAVWKTTKYGRSGSFRLVQDETGAAFAATSAVVTA